MTGYRSIAWNGDAVRMLDQRRLPHETVYLDLKTSDEVAAAIRDMVIRGAPAIGAAAAYGIVLAAKAAQGRSGAEAWRTVLDAADVIRAARPTAVNLFWAVDRLLAAMQPYEGHSERLVDVALEQAQVIEQMDVNTNRAIGQHALPLVPDGATIIHHCNTGSLATVDYGTALGVIRAAHEHGKHVQVLVDETRPRLQGARLTAWELAQLGIPHEIIVDGAAAHLMRTRKIDFCVVGCDRVAANGDVANKIGTYALALAARAHGVPFYVAAPCSTLDPHTGSGDDIAIEFRDAEEITCVGGTRIAPDGSAACNPAFDITPADLVTAFVTETGILHPPYAESLAEARNAADRAHAQRQT